MLVAGWYIQTRAAIAHVEALSRERIAAIEKGVALPEPAPEPPEPPERAGHPLKPTFATLAVGAALLLGLPPGTPGMGNGRGRLGHRGRVSLDRGWSKRVATATSHGGGEPPRLCGLLEGAGQVGSFGRCR